MKQGSCYKFLEIKKTTSKYAPFLSITLLAMLSLKVINCYYLQDFAYQRINTEKNTNVRISTGK